MRLQLQSHAGGFSDQFMSFPNKNEPLPPVPTPSKPSSSSQKLQSSSSSSAEWLPLSSVPGSTMGPPRPPPARISDAQFEINQNLVRPTTVDGAVDWINRHKPQIDQFLNLLEQYPQLVQSERLDTGKNPLPPIKRSVSESAVFPPGPRGNQNQSHHRLDNRLRRKKHQSGDKTRSRESASTFGGNTRYDGLVASERYIYVCDVLSDGEESLRQSSGPLPAPALPSAREKIVTALSSYCFVRTGPDRLQSETEFVELTHTIANADAFILLMNDRVLASGTCFHQLAVATAYNVPIIAIKEAGFKLSEPLAPELHDIEIIPRHDTTTSLNSHSTILENSDDSKKGKAKSETADLHESQSSGFHSESEGEDNKHSNLAELITDCYNESLLYVPNFHNSCISKLLGKLSEYLGEAYLDFEVSQQVGGEETALINDRMTIPRIGNTSTALELTTTKKGLLKLASNLRDKNDGISLKRESGNLPETPMSLDRSSGTPNSFAKLPPISKSPKSNAQMPGTRDTNRTNLSLDESEDPRDIQNRALSSNLESDHSDWDPSPESSPFLETKYIVFPSDELCLDKRPPFTVNFPQDISTIDRRRSSASTDDYGFNYVKLDFKYDIVAPSPIGFSFFDEEEEQPPKKPPPKKETKPRVKKPPKPIQVRVRNNRPVREQQLVKMATISIKYGMPV